MPFITLHEIVSDAKFHCVFTAGSDDVQVQLHSGALPGQAQSDNTYNFYVAGSEGEPGLLVVNGEFTTDVEEGDELWVRSAGGMSAWTSGGMPLTMLVRRRRRDGSSGQGASNPPKEASDDGERNG